MTNSQRILERVLREEPHELIKMTFYVIRGSKNSGLQSRCRIRMMSHRALSTGYPFNCPPKSDFYTLFHVTGRRQWYLRQTRDQFVKAAHVAQYRSRAAFKLSQLDEHHRFLDRAKCVIDLGAAPGSWSQLMTYRVRRNCQTQGPPRILAVDLLRIGMTLSGALCF